MENPWKTMGIPLVSMQIHGNSWNPTGLCGIVGIVILHSFFRCCNSHTSTFLFLFKSQQPLFHSRITLPLAWNHLPKELRRLPTDHEDLSLLFDHTHTSVRHFFHHHCRHPLLLLSSIPGSKLIFSTNPFLHSSSAFHPLTDFTNFSCFSILSGCRF